MGRVYHTEAADAQDFANVDRMSKHYGLVGCVFVFLQAWIFGLAIWAYLDASHNNSTVPAQFSITVAVSCLSFAVLFVQFILVGCFCMRKSKKPSRIWERARGWCGAGLGLTTYVVATCALCVTYSMVRYNSFANPTAMYFTDVGFATVSDLCFLCLMLCMTLFGRLLMGEHFNDAIQLSAAVMGDVVDVVDLSYYIYTPSYFTLTIPIKVFNFGFIGAFGLYPMFEKIYKSSWFRNHISHHTITSGMIWIGVKILWTHLPFIVLRSMLIVAFQQNSVNSIFLAKNVFEIVALLAELKQEWKRSSKEKAAASRAASNIDMSKSLAVESTSNEQMLAVQQQESVELEMMPH